MGNFSKIIVVGGLFFMLGDALYYSQSNNKYKDTNMPAGVGLLKTNFTII